MPYQLQAVELQRLASAAIATQQRLPGSTVPSFPLLEAIHSELSGVADARFWTKRKRRTVS